MHPRRPCGGTHRAGRHRALACCVSVVLRRLMHLSVVACRRWHCAVRCLLAARGDDVAVPVRRKNRLPRDGPPTGLWKFVAGRGCTAHVRCAGRCSVWNFHVLWADQLRPLDHYRRERAWCNMLAARCSTIVLTCAVYRLRAVGISQAFGMILGFSNVRVMRQTLALSSPRVSHVYDSGHHGPASVGCSEFFPGFCRRSLCGTCRWGALRFRALQRTDECAGYPTMGVAGAYAGPMFDILMGLGKSRFVVAIFA